MSEASFQPILGCFGDPLAGNPMQLLMERAFKAASLDWRFLSLEVPTERFAEAMRGARAMGFRGAAFASPHQIGALAFVDSLTPAAEAAGAVNCAVRQGEQWVGENTDGAGFLQVLKPIAAPTGMPVVICGAGGTARAIATALAGLAPASITIVNRTIERAEMLAAKLRERFELPIESLPWHDRWAIPAETRLLIHATTAGWCDPDDGPTFDWSAADPELIVADVIFNPAETRLLAEATKRGHRIVSGVDMMAAQAELAYRFWTGSDPAAGILHETLEEYLEV